MAAWSVSVVFTPVKTQRVYMHIADQIKDLIRKGVFPEGGQLPPERDLAEQLQVSRASLREALSALQILGLVETRPGQGTFICTGASSALLGLDSSWLYQDLESPFTILQARKAAEPPIAALAARQRSEASLKHLKEILDLVGNYPSDACVFYEGDRKFHLAIAEATENPVLLRMMSIVHDLMGQKLWLTLMMDSTLATPGRWQQAVLEHQSIYKAIEAQEEESAAARMKEHLDMVEKLMIEADLVRSNQIPLDRNMQRAASPVPTGSQR
jgi:GntR family transcriptional repressor for pyruvate dehydrogenase complex